MRYDAVLQNFFAKLPFLFLSLMLHCSADLNGESVWIEWHISWTQRRQRTVHATQQPDARLQLGHSVGGGGGDIEIQQLSLFLCKWHHQLPNENHHTRDQWPPVSSPDACKVKCFKTGKVIQAYAYLTASKSVSNRWFFEARNSHAFLLPFKWCHLYDYKCEISYLE